MIPRVETLTMEEVLGTSFKDYHVKGFDYICLRRTPKETVKLYFFDGDVSKMPEVVSPHDHRYDFSTMVVTGKSQNVWYHEATARQAAANSGEIYERFAYDTPLCGGTGFVHVGQTRLVEANRITYGAGKKYSMSFMEIHTIRMIENETVLCLTQFEDRVTASPTMTFMRDVEPPDLTGMYKRFTADEVLDTLRRLRERVPHINLPRIV